MSEVVVSAQHKASLVAQVQTEGYTFTIDESGLPEGVKTGPDPYELYFKCFRCLHRNYVTNVCPA